MCNSSRFRALNWAFPSFLFNIKAGFNTEGGEMYCHSGMEITVSMEEMNWCNLYQGLVKIIWGVWGYLCRSAADFPSPAFSTLIKPSQCFWEAFNNSKCLINAINSLQESAYQGEVSVFFQFNAVHIVHIKWNKSLSYANKIIWCESGYWNWYMIYESRAYSKCEVTELWIQVDWYGRKLPGYGDFPQIRCKSHTLYSLY